jgi:hypothetical protein
MWRVQVGIWGTYGGVALASRALRTSTAAWKKQQHVCTAAGCWSACSSTEASSAQGIAQIYC